MRHRRQAIVNRAYVSTERLLSLTHIIFMDDYDELGSYNGDVEHDMWVDYDHYQNTGEPDVFDKEDIDEIVDELNDWD